MSRHLHILFLNKLSKPFSRLATLQRHAMCGRLLRLHCEAGLGGFGYQTQLGTVCCSCTSSKPDAVIQSNSLPDCCFRGSSARCCCCLCCALWIWHWASSWHACLPLPWSTPGACHTHPKQAWQPNANLLVFVAVVIPSTAEHAKQLRSKALGEFSVIIAAGVRAAHRENRSEPGRIWIWGWCSWSGQHDGCPPGTVCRAEYWAKKGLGDGLAPAWQQCLSK